MISTTHSATLAPFLLTVLASTTNATARASGRCALNWSRTRGCPGTSMMRRGCLRLGRVAKAELVWREACVGRVCL